MTYFKDKVLPTLIVTAILALVALLANQLQLRSGLLIHLLGGIADGDAIYLNSGTADVRFLTERPIAIDQKTGAPTGYASVVGQDILLGDSSQKWIVRLKQK